MREIVSTHWEHHALIVGIVAILVVIFAPKGIVGLWRDWLTRLDRARRRSRGRDQAADRAMSEPVLRTEKLTKRFGGLTAVDNLSFSLAGGRLHAIIGPNGAGKTTFFNLISGLLPPDGGRVFFHGRDITGLTPHQISRLGIKRTLADQERVPAAVASRKISGSPAMPGSAFCIRSARPRSDRDTREKVERTLEQIGLAALARAAGRHAVLRRRRAARDRHGADLRSRGSCCSTSRPAA